MLFLSQFFGMLDLLESGNPATVPDWTVGFLWPAKGLSHFEKCFPSYYFFSKSKQEKHKQVWKWELAWRQLWSFLSGGICVSSSFGAVMLCESFGALTVWQKGRRASWAQETREEAEGEWWDAVILWRISQHIWELTSSTWLRITGVHPRWVATFRHWQAGAERSGTVVAVSHSASVSPFPSPLLLLSQSELELVPLSIPQWAHFHHYSNLYCDGEDKIYEFKIK